MLSNKSNKELVEAGHQFAKALDADMPLTEIAKLVSALSTRLECSIIRGNELQQKLDAMSAENADLTISRSILAENTLETCNALASVGSRHEAIMRGFMASTGNGNKYPKPITTLVNEALREIETPVTYAYLNSVRAEAVSNFWNKSLRDVAHVLNDIRAFDDSSEAAGIVHSEIKERVDDFVESLRSGTHDTADKAG